MPEDDVDNGPLRLAFARFSAQSQAERSGPDTAGVRRIARRRRTVRLAAMAAVAAVAVAMPVTAYGLGTRAAEPPAKQPPASAPASTEPAPATSSAPTPAGR
jgi:hypothetical protein